MLLADILDNLNDENISVMCKHYQKLFHNYEIIFDNLDNDHFFVQSQKETLEPIVNKLKKNN